MNDNRTGGTLLIIANLVGIVVMVLHPVAGHSPMTPASMHTLALLDRIVHGFAIAAMPMIFLGGLALNQRLTGGDRWPLAALVVFGFAAVAIMSAAAMSGFVGADIMSKMVEGDPKLESRRMLLDYTFRLNQAYSSIYTVGVCGAIILWSVAMRKSPGFPVALPVYGWVIGLAIPAALFAGVLTLDVHGMGLVALAQAIWFIIAGVALRRSESGPEATLSPGLPA